MSYIPAAAPCNMHGTKSRERYLIVKLNQIIRWSFSYFKSQLTKAITLAGKFKPQKVSCTRLVSKTSKEVSKRFAYPMELQGIKVLHKDKKTEIKVSIIGFHYKLGFLIECNVVPQ